MSVLTAEQKELLKARCQAAANQILDAGDNRNVERIYLELEGLFADLTKRLEESEASKVAFSDEVMREISAKIDGVRQDFYKLYLSRREIVDLKSASAEAERQLTELREPMACGHLKACWTDEPFDDDAPPPFPPGHCIVCEREKAQIATAYEDAAHAAEYSAEGFGDGTHADEARKIAEHIRTLTPADTKAAQAARDAEIEHKARLAGERDAYRKCAGYYRETYGQTVAADEMFVEWAEMAEAELTGLEKPAARG